MCTCKDCSPVPKDWPYSHDSWYADEDTLIETLGHTKGVTVIQAQEAYGKVVEDVVNNPQHYKVFPEAEAIDIISKVLTTEELKGYLKGNILKYRLRAGHKGDKLEQDIAKADKYREWLGDVS